MWHLWLGLALSLGLAGCQTYSAKNVRELPPGTAIRAVSVESCADRTGLGGARDLAGEGTAALIEALRASPVFEVAGDAPVMVSCDIETFVEGSAFLRWLAPGAGATKATVKVALWRMPGQELLATFQSKAQVSAGGLYTIGAEDYIVDVAMGDLVGEMEAWAKTGR